MEIIEAPAFTRQVTRHLGEEEYRVLQIELAGNPTLGDLMPGTGGFRKLRWADTRRGKGRRGGLRIIYYFFPGARQIWLMTLFGKNEAADLTPKEKRAMKAAIEAELHARRRARAKKLRRNPR